MNKVQPISRSEAGKPSSKEMKERAYNYAAKELNEKLRKCTLPVTYRVDEDIPINIEFCSDELVASLNEERNRITIELYAEYSKLEFNWHVELVTGSPIYYGPMKNKPIYWLKFI